MFDSFKKEKEEVALILDIGNGSIGVALASFSADQNPKVIYNTRLPFSITEKLDTDRLADTLSLLLDEILKTIVKVPISPGISSVLITFSSPWFVSKTKHIQITQDKPFVITKGFIEDVIENEEKTFLAELLEYEKSMRTEGHNSYTVIEKNIIHIKINGYNIQNSIGKKVTTFDGFLCLSVVEESIASKVRDLVIKHTHIAKDRIGMHTFPLVSFSVIRDIYPSPTDFLIMDITGEVTDLTLVTDDVIQKISAFPSGRNFIIRQVAKAFDFSTEIALSCIRMCVEGKAEPSVSTKMDELLVSVEKEWAIYFEDALSRLSANMVLPNRIYITGESDVAPIFIKFLKMQKTDTTYNFRKNIDIVYVTHGVLSHLYTSDPKSLKDEFMAIISIFYSKIIKSR